jgi:hypothetical protein
MRLIVSILCVAFLMSLCVAEPAAAKGGKGHGGRGRRWTTQRHEHHHGGHQHQWTEKSPTPAKENGVKENVAKEHKRQETLGKHQSQPLPEDVGDGTTEPYNKKQQQLLIEQRNRDKRIAQAQHLREIAERNGNANLAANADRMEAFAHDHYARRVQHLEKFGVTDPLLNPDGGMLDPHDSEGGVLDPVEDGPVSNLVESWLPWLR